MKSSSFLLTLSLVGNLALCALILRKNSGLADSQAAPASSAANGATTPHSAGISALSSEEASLDPKFWSGLAEGDYGALVAQLRAEGFPPAVIRAIVAAEVKESFAARRKALTPTKDDVPFWQTEKPTDPKVLAALRELAREQAKVMKELLGSAAATDDDPIYAASLRQRFGNLPAENIEQLIAIERDYGELRRDVYSAAGMGGGGSTATLTPDDRAKLALLEKEQRADMQQILSPKEFENYELRASRTASTMRYQLSAFSPTEQEFRSIFALQRKFDEQYPQSIGTSAEILQQRKEAQKHLTSEIKAALGTERGEDYERAINDNYRQLHAIVNRLALPPESVNQVWTVQKDIEQRVSAMQLNSKLPSAAKTEQLAALAQEAATKLTGALGERGLDIYKQYGAYWLHSLQERAARGSPGAPPATP